MLGIVCFFANAVWVGSGVNNQTNPYDYHTGVVKPGLADRAAEMDARSVLVPIPPLTNRPISK